MNYIIQKCRTPFEKLWIKAEANCFKFNSFKLLLFFFFFWGGGCISACDSQYFAFYLLLQLPVRVGIHSPQARQNYEHTMTCLIQISRYKFSLILAGLTKALQRTNESVSCFLLLLLLLLIFIHYRLFNKILWPWAINNWTIWIIILRQWATGTIRQIEPERCYYDTLIIILTTLERCLSNQTKDTSRFEEAMNVKLLLRELCQFIDVNESNPNAQSLKALASKVIFSLSQNHFSAVFNRILARLQELSATSEENPDSGDIELIQHIDLDIQRLIKLLTGILHSKCSTVHNGTSNSIRIHSFRNQSKVPFG